MKRKKRVSSPSTHETGIVRLGDVLPQLIAKYGVQQRRDVEQIEEAWRSVIGEPYASVGRVVGLSRGTLEIALPHNAFVQELSFRQTELLVEIRAALPGEKIRKIKFVVRQ